MENVENGRNASSDFPVLCNYHFAAAVCRCHWEVLALSLHFSRQSATRTLTHWAHNFVAEKSAEQTHHEEVSIAKDNKKVTRERRKERKKQNFYGRSFCLVGRLLRPFWHHNDQRRRAAPRRHETLSSSWEFNETRKCLKINKVIKFEGHRSVLAAVFMTLHHSLQLFSHTYESLSPHAFKGLVEIMWFSYFLKMQ